MQRCLILEKINLRKIWATRHFCQPHVPIVLLTWKMGGFKQKVVCSEFVFNRLIYPSIHPSINKKQIFILTRFVWDPPRWHSLKSWLKPYSCRYQTWVDKLGNYYLLSIFMVCIVDKAKSSWTTLLILHHPHTEGLSWEHKSYQDEQSDWCQQST